MKQKIIASILSHAISAIDEMKVSPKDILPSHIILPHREFLCYFIHGKTKDDEPMYMIGFPVEIRMVEDFEEKQLSVYFSAFSISNSNSIVYFPNKLVDQAIIIPLDESVIDIYHAAIIRFYGMDRLKNSKIFDDQTSSGSDIIH